MREPAKIKRASTLGWGAAIGFATAIVLTFFGIRVVTDWPSIIAGVIPEDDFAKRYVAHPLIGYGHMVPGMLYLLGAPLQLSRRFRARHYTLHRRFGRFLLGCALLSGVLAFILGIGFPWGGAVESLAAVVFGAWFMFCLLRAFSAIRANRVPAHRRWMIRAFAVSIGIATIRIWVGFFTGIQLVVLGMVDSTFPVMSTFGASFWLGLGMHVVIGEWWLRRTPDLDG